MPTLAKRIHDENEAGDFKINLAGLGIGNGVTAPEHSTVYADYLYQVRKTARNDFFHVPRLFLPSPVSWTARPGTSYWRWRTK